MDIKYTEKWELKKDEESKYIFKKFCQLWWLSIDMWVKGNFPLSESRFLHKHQGPVTPYELSMLLGRREC